MTHSQPPLKVLVTRPEHQARSLSAAIQSQGHIPLPLPLLEIKPLRDEAQLAEVSKTIQDLDNFHILIFVSTNAVQFGADLIDKHWPRFPVGLRVIAIGPSTAEMAAERLQCEVIQPQRGMDSEAILDMAVLREVGGKRVAIVRGLGGRELMAQTLRDRGANVSYIEVYSRAPRVYTEDVLGQYLDNPGIDVITITSGESLEQLLGLAEHNKAQLCLLPIIVPSRRVAAQALRAGFQRVIDASGAADENLVCALQNLAAGAD